MHYREGGEGEGIYFLISIILNIDRLHKFLNKYWIKHNLGIS